VFVDLPVDEAYAPLYLSIQRSAVLLLLALVLAFTVGIVLARRMIVPIRALHEGAAQIGGGDLVTHALPSRPAMSSRSWAMPSTRWRIAWKESYSTLNARSRAAHANSGRHQAKSDSWLSPARPASATARAGMFVGQL